MVNIKLAIITVAAISGCSSNANPHDLCDCDEKIAQLETENSKLNDRVDALESQVADLMTTTTTTTTTTTEEVEQTTAATTKSTTKAQGGGGGNKTTKATTKATTTASTAAPTTAKPTSAPTNSDGFGTDVGM